MRPGIAAPAVVLAALLSDAGGVHGLAYWLVLVSLPAAAAAAFVGLSDALEGLGWLRGLSASFALVLLVLGSAVRETAPRGASVPTLALSAGVMALICYSLPALAWLFSEPLSSLRTAGPRPRASRA